MLVTDRSTAKVCPKTSSSDRNEKHGSVDSDGSQLNCLGLSGYPMNRGDRICRMSSNGEIGVKKISRDNWLAPDPIWEVFHRLEENPLQAWVDDFFDGSVEGQCTD